MHRNKMDECEEINDKKLANGVRSELDIFEKYS